MLESLTIGIKISEGIQNRNILSNQLSEQEQATVVKVSRAGGSFKKIHGEPI